MRRWIALTAVPAAFLAGGVALASDHHVTRAAKMAGGLALSPAVLTHAAQPGDLGSISVINHSAAPLAVTVAPRPWTQSASGRFAAARKGTLAGVSVSTPSFTLAPGAEQNVGLTLSGAPAGGSLYGALEVIGLPTDADKRTGVVLGYRLVGSLRLVPAQKRYSLKAGEAKRSGRAVVLPLTNRGNTIDPITGRVTIKSARGTIDNDVDDLRILPGKKVNLELAAGLKRGSYSATVTLRQGGTKLLTAKRRFSVR